MEAIDEMKNLWEKSKKEGDVDNLREGDVLIMIKSRVNKEKRTIAQYTLASWVWQFIGYTLLVNMIVRFWGNWISVLACLAGILVFAQFTIKYARFCSKIIKSAGKQLTTVEALSDSLKTQQANLNEFFTFKKKFDFIGIPVLGVVIVMILSAFDILPGLDLNPAPVILLFALIQTIFIMATMVEDKKRFIAPLERMDVMIKELSTEL